jgi:hypothetical protein
MPRRRWYALAAHVLRIAPARPGSQWQPIAALNVARAAHGGAEIERAVFVLGGWPDTQFSRALAEVER